MYQNYSDFIERLYQLSELLYLATGDKNAVKEIHLSRKAYADFIGANNKLYGVEHITLATPYGGAIKIKPYPEPEIDQTAIMRTRIDEEVEKFRETLRKEFLAMSTVPRMNIGGSDGFKES